MRTGHLFGLFLLTWSLWVGVGFSGPASAVLVDRILGVVNDEIIAFSDVRKYQALFGQGRDTEAILEELIDQKLLLAEARKFEISEPTDEAVEESYRKLVKRFGDRVALAGLLQRLNLSGDELRQAIRARLLVDQLLEQRINFFVFVSPQDVDAYYQAHAEEFRGQSVEQARAAIQDLLTHQKADLKRKAYLDRLRARATIRLN